MMPEQNQLINLSAPHPHVNEISFAEPLFNRQLGRRRPVRTTALNLPSVAAPWASSYATTK